MKVILVLLIIAINTTPNLCQVVVTTPAIVTATNVALACQKEILKCLKRNKIGTCMAAVTCKGLNTNVCLHMLMGLTYGIPGALRTP
ncbi:unnamed protein product [Oppiella nova]|uniref:Uncharacterized protein n=1 Tax=Oppiella nova TaxID=334625 RepID=A0A7R9QHS9_9ACAR|nr:unnamed protein product [Oppiella nova]CAG2165276.1 unnamed protein product [Oppiella nova]